ncbi:hypothetical protein PR001_g22961 [Phytophthora rubi]|uniref:RxLR effector protein n=1 Tax=Phytophthora rubi TaxID=129364 RepID=A0A6A3ISW3_9STRA|nr:hypothetical protein PR001_g22961 [Phytophthora rubi]
MGSLILLFVCAPLFIVPAGRTYSHNVLHARRPSKYKCHIRRPWPRGWYRPGRTGGDVQYDC